jgi:hypothetical protein
VKEQIISLDANDDLNSLRDKLVRAQSARILLRWPSAHSALNRRLDVELARRWARTAGSEIVIVSSDSAVQALAASARVPWFADEAAAAIASPRMLRRFDPPPPLRPAHRSFGSGPLAPPSLSDWSSRWPAGLRVVVGLLAVFSVVLIPLLGFPAAEVRAEFPARQVTGSAALDTSQASRISIPVLATSRRPTSGRAVAPSTYAAGSIQLTNTSQTILSIPAGLIVSDNLGIGFETTQGVILLPGADASVPIRARRPGSASNFPANRINRVEGQLGLLLRATNLASITGGGENMRGMVTAADEDALQKELATAIQNQAASGLRTAAGPDRALADASIQIAIDPSSAPDAAPGSPADSVGQTLRATVTGLAFSRTDLAAASSYMLRLSLHPGEQLDASTITYSIEPANAGGWRLVAVGSAFPAPDTQAVTAALRGQSIAGAQSMLRNQYGAVGAPTILIDPAWIPWLPLFPFRIHLTLRPAAG